MNISLIVVLKDLKTGLYNVKIFNARNESFNFKVFKEKYPESVIAYSTYVYSSKEESEIILNRRLEKYKIKPNWYNLNNLNIEGIIELFNYF